MMLGVRPGTGLRVALEQPDRVDALFLDRVGHPGRRPAAADRRRGAVDAMPQPTEVGVQRVLEMLRHRFNYIVIDLPMPPGPAERIALAAARHVRAGAGAGHRRHPRRASPAQADRPAGSCPRVRSCSNRAGVPGALKPKLVEEGLGAAPDVVIPDLPKQLPRAGQSGHARRSARARRCAGRWRPLTAGDRRGVAAPSGGTASLLGRLFRGLRR